MTKTVSAFDQVKSNILRFAEEVDESEGLQDRLGYNRSWYAIRNEDDNWMFGPSKFIGYVGLSADDYLKDTYSLDGKVTERILKEWFVCIGPDHPEYAKLREALVDQLDWFDKVPSSAARINVPLDYFEKRSDRNSGLDRNLADLVIAVASSLPETELRRIRKAL